ncbi:MAG: hypothetical protein H6702_22200 [Myxococcales bacterium]|nr:hypothetical protein [Myxococcales bacterium]
MPLHPLLLALLALDAAAAVLVVAAAVPAVKALLDWRPGAADRAQLALERRLEAASLQGRLAFAAWGTGLLVWAVAVASVLPALVPGAMCGTGVMEAMGGAGGRALLLRLGALLALGAWHLVDRLDRARPDGAAAQAAAKGLLLATPVVLLAAWDSVGAVLRLDTHTAVDCCAVVYDATKAQGGALGQVDAAGWLWSAGSLGAAVLVLAGWVAVRARPGPAAAALGVLAPLWVLPAGGALIQVLAAYRYEVLAHRCPWCLFLAEHGRVGYPLFGALALVALEGGAAGIIRGLARGRPGLAEAAHGRLRRAGLAVVGAVLLFGWLALAPALRWYQRTGVWLH